jgi:hypothetical protein
MEVYSLTILPVLILAAVIIIISIILYNRRLDRIARGEQRDAHSNMPDPRTTTSFIYKAVLLVLVILTFLNTSSLKSQLDSLQSAMYSRMNDLNRAISELESRLEEEERRVFDFQWEVKDTDLENETATVQLSAFLKEYTSETSGFFSVGGRSVPLTLREDGALIGEFSENIFADLGEVKIVIKEGERSTAENLDWMGTLYESVLPVPNLHTNDREIRNGRIIGGTYGLAVSPVFYDDIERVNAVYITGGKEVRSADITEKVLKDEYISIDTDIKNEDYLVLRVDLYTKSGLTIKERLILDYPMPNADYNCWIHDVQRQVYDQNGMLLYTTDNTGAATVW